MRKLGYSLTVLMCLGLAFAVFATDAVAQNLEPCCVGGRHPMKRCKVDTDCPDLCVGGFRPGGVCREDLHCVNECVGGTSAGDPCLIDEDCQNFCVGGSNAGGPCSDDSDCPGGSCSDVSNCSNIGTCSNVGTCTGLCPSRRIKLSPSEPATDWPDLIEIEGEVQIEACP